MPVYRGTVNKPSRLAIAIEGTKPPPPCTRRDLFGADRSFRRYRVIDAVGCRHQRQFLQCLASWAVHISRSHRHQSNVPRRLTKQSLAPASKYTAAPDERQRMGSSSSSSEHRHADTEVCCPCFAIFLHCQSKRGTSAFETATLCPIDTGYYAVVRKAVTAASLVCTVCTLTIIIRVLVHILVLFSVPNVGAVHELCPASE